MAGYDRPSGQMMDISSLRAVLDSEKTSAMAAYRAGKLSLERSKAIDYYLGDVTSDIPDEDGKSKAVSSDVFDTIQGILPSLMDIFCGGDEVVKFEPNGPDDVAAAEQETDYVNFVFMEQNPGFLTLHTMFLDGLLSKTGLVKVYWDKREEEEEETFYDMTDDQFALLANDPDIEIVNHTIKDTPSGVDADQDPTSNPSYT